MTILSFAAITARENFIKLVLKKARPVLIAVVKLAFI